jgi:hypothetical protein
LKAFSRAWQPEQTEAAPPGTEDGDHRLRLDVDERMSLRIKLSLQAAEIEIYPHVWILLRPCVKLYCDETTVRLVINLEVSMTPYDPRDLQTKRPTAWEVFEKGVIPLALILLAASQAKVASDQLRVAKLQNERQAAEADANLQIKYMELFYHDLSDPDPRRKQASIALLTVMRPDFAQMISRVILLDPQSSDSLKQQTSATLDNVRRFGPLLNYKLVVYFPKAASEEAKRIRARLVATGFPGIVQLLQKDPNFLDDATKFGYHIRYDENYEDEPADYLLRILPECLPEKKFTKVPVTGKKNGDGIITIFLFERGRGTP